MKTEEDLSTEAARIDQAAREEEAGNAIDNAIGSTEPAAPSTSAPRPVAKGKKKGKSGRPKKNAAPGKPNEPEVPAAAPGAEGEETGEVEFLRGAISAAVDAGLQLAKRSGWTSPATKIQSEPDWISAVAHCIDSMRVKYLGQSLDEYQEEAALVLLVAPWALSNVLRLIDERKSRSISRGDRRREDLENVSANSNGATGDPDRSDGGQQKLQ